MEVKFNSGVAHKGDCIQVMKNIPDKSVHLVLADLPYQKTALEWDKHIPIQDLWNEYKRVITKNGAILLFGVQPFSSLLVNSNLKMFKYEWFWIKNTQTGMTFAGKQPMRKYENILVFYNQQPTFNETKIEASAFSKKLAKTGLEYQNSASQIYDVSGGKKVSWSELTHCNNIIYCNTVGNNSKERIHPSQKPTELLGYFIRTYTNEGETVLDNVAGSFSTAIASIENKRKWIAIEQDENYFNNGINRLNKLNIKV